MIETRNAIIRKVRLGIEDHGLLSAWLDLDYGGSIQGFGGWNLGAKGANYCGEFIKCCLQTTGVNDWDDLPGTAIRARAEHTQVRAIGHIVEDRWFTPGDVFALLEKAA